MTIETEAQMRARHAKELRDNRAEQKRIEQRDDRDEKHLAKWLRKRHYAHFRELADMRDADLAARREKTRSRVEKHRAEPDVTHVETGGVTPVEARESWARDESHGDQYA
mgnify:CR=1 FL=1